MSIIGWEVYVIALENKFKVTVPDEFVMRIKYDPDTGKKLPGKQKVLTKPGYSELRFNFPEIETEYDCALDDIGMFVIELVESLDMDYEFAGHCVYFGVNIEDGCTFSSIVKMKTKLEVIKKKLIKFGIPFDRKQPPKFRSYSY